MNTYADVFEHYADQVWSAEQRLQQLLAYLGMDTTPSPARFAAYLEERRTGNTSLVIHVESDECDNPAHDDGWKPYSFNTRHESYKDPEDLGLSLEMEDGRPKVLNKKLKKKLEAGLAFFLSYYEHGDCLWFLPGSYSPPDMQWDGNRNAGLLVWEHAASALGAKTYEDRVKDASGFLRTYTDWCNGHGFRYRIETAYGEELDDCGWCYQTHIESYVSEIRAVVGQREYTVVGELAFLLAGYDLKQTQTVPTT